MTGAAVACPCLGLTHKRRSRYRQEMGELAALLSAFTWAASNAIVGSQLARLPAVVVSAVRLLGGLLLLWALSLALLLADQLRAPQPAAVLALAGSAVLGLAAGDTLYFAGMRRIGLARAAPISMAAFPLFSVVLAAVLVGEPITPAVVGGAVLIVLGLYLVTSRTRVAATSAAAPTPALVRSDDGSRWWGMGLVLLAALLWALAGVWLRWGAAGVSPALAGAIRLSAAALVTAAAVHAVGQRLWPVRADRRRFLVLGVAGMVGTGLGSMLYVVGVQQAGVARAAILSSTTPLFALPLAALVLHERLTGRLVGGALVSVVGIWLVVH